MSPAAVVLKLTTRWGSKAESEHGADPALAVRARLEELCWPSQLQLPHSP